MVLRQQVADDMSLMAIVKADAYGHGAVMCLPTLLGAGVTELGVASIDEALQIREAGFSDVPLLVIGPTPAWAVEAALRKNIALSVYDQAQCEHIIRVCQQQKLPPATVQVKVDTGMHRIGVHWEEAAAFTEWCQQQAAVTVAGIFSHLAWAENTDFSHTQHQRFQSVLQQLATLPPKRHLLNSAGTLLYPAMVGATDISYTGVRVGLALWGYTECETTQHQLRPVMQLKARVAALQTVPASDGVSYNHTNTTAPTLNANRRIATLPVGYADGVPRGLSNRMTVWAKGVHCPQVGNITMDQLMVDVSAAEGLLVGESITLFGGEGGITLSDWAAMLNTIEYELMCALRVRLPRTYTR